MRKELIVCTLALAAVLLATTPLPATDLAIDLGLAPEAAFCPISPKDGAVAMAPPCSSCTAQFSPQSGVVCTWDGTCTGHGSNECCNYSCGCGDSTGLPGTPSNACQFSLPQQCLSQFSPRLGIVCTATGTCQEGSCCEYDCTCGVSDGLPGTPANACEPLDLPCGCCAGGLGCRGLCTTGYCNGPGERCVPVGCGFGCCIYQCGFPFPSCTGFDPVSPDAC